MRSFWLSGFILTTILLTVSGPVRSQPYETAWVCLGDMKKARAGTFWASPVVDRSRERFYAEYRNNKGDDDPHRITQALFAFSAPYSKVQPLLRRLAAKKFGQDRAKETPKASFLQNYIETLDRSDRWNDDSKSFAEIEQDEQAKKLERHGIRVEGFHQTVFNSKAYNDTWVSDGASRLTFWIIDAMDVLGVSGTLVVAKRVDRATVFGMHGHAGIRGFWRVKFELLTNSEYDVLAAVARELGVPFMAAPTGSPMPIRRPESLVAAKRWLLSQRTRSPEQGAPLQLDRCPDAPARPPIGPPESDPSRSAE